MKGTVPAILSAGLQLVTEEVTGELRVAVMVLVVLLVCTSTAATM